MTAPPARRAAGAAGRPSTTANVELLDGAVLVGPFGDYSRLPDAARSRDLRELRKNT